MGSGYGFERLRNRDSSEKKKGADSMLRSLFSGVSGLRAHQTKMDAIGNNIANVNTYGYKSQRVTFKDSFYQTVSNASEATDNLGGGNPAQIGYGAVIGSIDVLHTRGGYVPTGQPLDIFIEGEGYLVARDSTGKEAFTRVGILSFDGEGNLVDANRRYICGYPIARYGGSSASSKVQLENMQIDFGEANGSTFDGYRIVTTSSGTGASVNVGSKTITIRGDSLDSPSDVQAALRDMSETNGSLPSSVNLNAITVSGSGSLTEGKSYTQIVTGGAQNANGVIFDTVPAKAATITTEDLEIDFGDSNGAYFNGFQIKTVRDSEQSADAKAEVDLANKVITVTSRLSSVSKADLEEALQEMTVKQGSGTLPTNIDPNLITVSGTGSSLEMDVTTSKAVDGTDMVQTTRLDKSNGLQKIKIPGTFLDSNEDGYYDNELSESVMELKNIKISENGIISGEDSNGKIIQIGQVCLADVPNPQALTLDGNSYLDAAGNTGTIKYNEPGEGAVGTFVSGGLENSNVDLANEFSDMIMTQRGFQACSRIITVGDEMLQELVNLKR